MNYKYFLFAIIVEQFIAVQLRLRSDKIKINDYDVDEDNEGQYLENDKQEHQFEKDYESVDPIDNKDNTGYNYPRYRLKDLSINTTF